MAREIAVVLQAKDQTAPAFQSVTSRLKGLGSLLKVGAASFAAVGVAGVAAIGKLAVDSAKVDKLRDTFKQLSAEAGDTYPDALDKMRKATRGMVADADIFTGVNKFLAMQIADSTDEAAELTEMAVQLGMAMGTDAAPAMENFALMMANQSIPRMDTYGMSGAKARERIQELMDTTADMTREEAFKIAVMEQGRETMERLGEQGQGAAADMARFRAQVSNVKDAFGKAFLPILSKVMKVLTPAVTWIGKKAVPYVEWFASGIERMADTFGTLHQYISVVLEDGDYLNDFLVDLPAAIQSPVRMVGRLIDGVRSLARYLSAGAPGRDAMTDWLGGLPARLQGPVQMLGRLTVKAREVGSALRDFASRGREWLGWIAGRVGGLWQEKLLPGFRAITGGLRTWWETGPISRALQTVRDGWQSRIVTPVANWWQTSGLAQRFGAITTAVSSWWSEEGGVAGILQTIREGWAGRVAQVKGWWEGSRVKAGFAGIQKGVSDWWAEQGGAQGILGKIGAGWQTHIADPLDNFWIKGKMGERFEAIRAGISEWWTEQTGEMGVLGAIQAGWKTYLADPLVAFWQTSGISEGFATFTAQLSSWWETVKKSAEEAMTKLEELRQRDPTQDWGAPTARTGLLGLWDRLRDTGPVIAFGEMIQIHVIDRFKAWKELAGAVIKLLVELDELKLTLIGGAILGITEKLTSTEGKERDVIGLIRAWIKDMPDLTNAFMNFGAWANRTMDDLTGRVYSLADAIEALTDALQEGQGLGGGVGVGLDELAKGMPRYQYGGTVPGPRGQPRLVVAHGGEEYLGVGRRRRRQPAVYNDFRGASFYGIDEQMVEELFEERSRQQALAGVRE